MNILFLDQFNSLGGAQQCLLDLLPASRENSWTPHVAIPSGGPLSARLESDGIPVHPIRCGPYTSTKKTTLDHGRFAIDTPLLAAQIWKLIRAHNIDLLYVNGPRVLPGAAIAARRRKLPLVFHCHVRLGQASAIRTAGWALRYADATMIGCCKFAAEPLLRYVPPPKMHVIYNGMTDMAGSRPAGISRIGIIGRIERDKGQMEFVEAARLLLNAFPGLRFSVTGAPLFSSPGYSQSVHEAARGLPVEFHGWKENIPEAYSSIDLLAVPSAAHDPNPRVILEAFSARVPVVAFPSGGIPEVVTDGKNGFLTSGHSASLLAARIGDVLRMEPAVRASVIDQARADWAGKFTVDRFRREIAGCIAQALS